MHNNNIRMSNELVQKKAHKEWMNTTPSGMGGWRCKVLHVFYLMACQLDSGGLYSSLLPVYETFANTLTPCRWVQLVEEEPSGLTIGEPPKNTRNLIG